MSKRWQIYRDGKLVGAMTSVEIRQALRDGKVDPFDRVCQEGSNVSRQLVECDDIFNIEGNQDDNSGTNAEKMGVDRLKMARTVVAGKDFILPKKPAKTTQVFSAPGPTEKARNDGQVKEFYVKSRTGKVLGPLNPREIQSLFHRDIFKKTDRVRKVGAKKSIPMEQFVAAYAGAVIKAIETERDNPSIGASSRVLNELSRGVLTRKKSRMTLILRIAVPILVLAAFAIFGFLIVKNWAHLFETRTVPQGNEVVHPRPGGKRGKAMIKLKKIEEKVLRPSREQSGQKSVPVKKPKNPPPKEPESRIRQSQPQIRKLIPKRALPPFRHPPSWVRPAKPVIRPLNLAGLIGRKSEIGPMTYDRGELVRCTLKCRLSLRHASGVIVTGIFFKAAFEGALMRKSSVFVNGVVRREPTGYVILIQGVR